MKQSKDNMINIGTDYSIQGDRTCLTLYKRRVVKKTGKLQWDVIGYFDTFEHLFHRLVDEEVNPINNLQDIAERIVELKNWISDTVKSIPRESIIK